MDNKSRSLDPLVIVGNANNQDSLVEENANVNELYCSRTSLDESVPSAPLASLENITAHFADGDNLACMSEENSDIEERKREIDENQICENNIANQQYLQDEESEPLSSHTNLPNIPALNRVSHSCAASSASARDLCHSRGESTDGSTMDAFTVSAIESRRGTYSEAGTLPIGSVPPGSTIIEENDNSLEKSSDKKASLNKDSLEGVKFPCTFDCCHIFLRKHNALPASPSKAERLKYALSCPPHGKVGRLLTWLLIIFLTWGFLISMTGLAALPGGNLFSLLILFVTAVIGGHLVSAIKLPALLGMLIVGIILSSVPKIDIIGSSIKQEWSITLRGIALVVILIRAGLGLDPAALKQLSFMVIRLAFSPCLVETVTVAVVTHFVLQFPWLWGFLLGFILAAVSPAVVVPCLLTLSDQGYGVDKGIPTLVIAAASVDDVLAISGFGIVLGIIFSEGSFTWQILKGPLEVLIGITYGLMMGTLCWILPYKHDKNIPTLRFFILFGIGLFALYGSEMNPVQEYFNLTWLFFQPLLFGLIGTEIQVTKLDHATIGWGILTLAIGLTFRIVTSFLAVFGGNLNLKEKVFVALAWLPKATVQAAIGSQALDYAKKNESSEEYEHLGKQVLTIAVLVILITAPIGAAVIMLSAPKLLKKTLPSGIARSDPETPV